jgi:antiviral helicase SKI2
VLALVDKSQLTRKSDIKDEEVPPRWPPVLEKGAYWEPRWELTAVNSSSIAFITDRLYRTDVGSEKVPNKQKDTQQLDIVSILDKRSKEVAAETSKRLAVIYDELVESGLQEFDWARLTNLEFQELLRQRFALTDRVSLLGCQLCKEFDDHVSCNVPYVKTDNQYDIIQERKMVEGSLKQLKLALSDQNLELLPDYESRVEVLKELQFIDDNSTVLLKGRVACEINSAHELILTELILDNILADYTPEEAVALLSVFVFVEKTESQPAIPAKLAQGLDTIYHIADNVENTQLRRNVAFEDFREKFKPGLVEVVYEWAKGMVRVACAVYILTQQQPFSDITKLSDVPEGSIVRVITRLDETCREVRDAARVIGDADLFQKMEEAQALIKRDSEFRAVGLEDKTDAPVVFAASLYL